MKLLNLKKSVMILSTLAFVMMSQSCKDVLKEDVISQIGNEYLDSPKGFNDAVNAAYSSLRSYYGSQQGLTFTEYGTDIYATGADGGYKGFHFYDNQLNSSVDWLANVWDDLYRGINTCNAVIVRGQKPITGITDAIRNQRVGEAKFLRATYYFLLYMHWGGVDLRLDETKTPTKVATRASDKAMFDAIITDLEAALPVLEAKKASSDYGRATKPAAEHLLGYVLLTRNNTASKGADDLNKAITYLSNVVNNTAYGFQLLPDFASVFDENNQINNEIVFAVQYTADPTTNADIINNNGNVGGNNLHLFFPCQYDTQTGMTRDVANGRPFKRLRPTKYCIETVFGDKVNDSRFKKSFKDTWLCNRPGTYTAFALDPSKAGKSIAMKLGDTAFVLSPVEVPVAERATKNYQVVVPSFVGGYFNEAIFFSLTKFMDTKRPDMTYTHGSRDLFVMRLANTKLLLAEALLLANRKAEALVQVNQVRQRAAFPGRTAQMAITEAQLTMDYIMEERARELAGEQIRWLDLKRWGKLVERVKAHNPQAAAFIKDIHNLRPIPQAQIDRTEGGAASFPQNPGY
jgi:starch-binding outer membrane protein, SusD/RagB family